MVDEALLELLDGEDAGWLISYLNLRSWTRRFQQASLDLALLAVAFFLDAWCFADDDGAAQLGVVILWCDLAALFVSWNLSIHLRDRIWRRLGKTPRPKIKWR